MHPASFCFVINSKKKRDAEKKEDEDRNIPIWEFDVIITAQKSTVVGLANIQFFACLREHLKQSTGQYKLRWIEKDERREKTPKSQEVPRGYHT